MTNLDLNGTASGADRNTLTALFESKTDAQKAVDKLIAAGVSQSSVRLLPGYENDGDLQPAAGEVHRGFFASLADFFMPDEDRYAYAEGLSRGGYLVTATDIPAPLYDQALDILDDQGAVDLDDRQGTWRQQGWTGYQPSVPADAADYTAASRSSGASRTGATPTSTGRTGQEEVIPVVQEDLQVGKRDVSHGRVRVRSYVVEEPVSEQVNLRDETVRVERRPVDRALQPGDAAFQDRTIEAEERAEEAVVQKTARVVEEVAISKDSTQRQQTISDSVKRTEVEVEDERGKVS